MKKLYAILVAGLASVGTLTASAAPALPKAVVTPEVREKMTQRVADFMTTQNMVGMEEIGTRSYTSGNMLYTLRFIRDYDNEWYKVLSFTDPETGLPIPDEKKTFEMYPFYNVMVTLAGYDMTNGGTVSTYLPFYTFWPCYYWFSQQYEEAGEPIPEDKRDYGMVSINDLASAKQNSFCGLFREFRTVGDGFDPNPYITTDGDIEAWSIMSGDMCAQVAGVQYMYNGGTATTYQDTNTGAIMEYDFRSYIPESNELSVGLKYPLIYKTSSGGDRRITLNVAYQGTIRQDLTPRDINWGISDMHIFYTGEASSKILGNKDPYNLEAWGPLDRYYIAASLTDYIRVNYPENMTKFNQSQVGFMFKDDAPAEIQLNPESQSYLIGGFYKATGSKDPYGEYKVLDLVYEIDPDWGAMLATKPVPGAMIPAYEIAVYDDNDQALPTDNSYIELDGLQVVIESSNESLLEGSKAVIGGDRGTEFVGEDFYKNTVMLTYTDKIKFHGDPNNATAFEEIDSYGKNNDVAEIATENSIVKVVNGAVVVNAASDVEVIVYALDGVAVKSVVVKGGNAATIELNKGIYVVKAGDEVVKVAL